MFQFVKLFWQSFFASFWLSTKVFDKCIVLFCFFNKFSNTISLFISLFFHLEKSLSEFFNLFDFVFENIMFAFLFTLFGCFLWFVIFGSDLFLTLKEYVQFVQLVLGFFICFSFLFIWYFKVQAFSTNRFFLEGEGFQCQWWWIQHQRHTHF